MSRNAPSTEISVADDSWTDHHFTTDTEARTGTRYLICRHCGRESVPADPAAILHTTDCPLSRGY